MHAIDVDIILFFLVLSFLIHSLYVEINLVLFPCLYFHYFICPTFCLSIFFYFISLDGDISPLFFSWLWSCLTRWLLFSLSLFLIYHSRLCFFPARCFFIFIFSCSLAFSGSRVPFTPSIVLSGTFVWLLYRYISLWFILQPLHLFLLST